MASFFEQLGSFALDVVVDTASALKERLAKAAPPTGEDDVDAPGFGPPDNGPPKPPGRASGNNAGDSSENQGLPLSPLVAKLPEPTYEEAPPTQRELVRAKRKEEMAAMDPQSLLFDPMAIVNALGYKDKPSPMTYATLRAMSYRTPIVSAIIKSRCTQVSNFATPVEDKYSLGFRVRLRDRKAKATPTTERESKRLTQWLQRTANVTDQQAVNRDDFETFLRKVTRDSLTYDQMTFEVIPARNGKPYGFQAVDAATMRIADSTKLHIPDSDLETPRFVQVYDGLVVSTFTASQLCFGVRNPTTTIGMQGYGVSELEQMVRVVTAVLWGIDYNMKFFSQGTSAKGVLNIKGTISEKQLRAFRQHWYSMVAGVENSFKTPILNADEAQWLNMQSSNRDMEFSAWMDFLIKVVAAIYDMDPMEVNFKYGDTGSKSMFESSNQQKLSASKDKGLKPLLRFIANKLNAHCIYQLNEDFEVEFVGLDAQSPQEAADLTTKLSSSIKTIDECRAEEDLAPLPNGAGAIIRDPVWLQHLQAASAPQGPEGGGMGLDTNPFGEDEGEGDDGGGGEGEGDSGNEGVPKPNPFGGDGPAKPAGPPKPNPFGKALPPKKLAKALPPRNNIVIDVEV